MQISQSLEKDNNIINKKPIIGVFISIPKCASKTILDMFDLGLNRDNHYSEI